MDFFMKMYIGNGLKKIEPLYFVTIKGGEILKDMAITQITVGMHSKQEIFVDR